MSAAYVQVAVDSTGKKVQTFENTVGSDVVESQGVVLVNTAGVAITTLPISVATVPSHDVTNAGTFAVQVAARPGAANMANGQVTASGSAATLITSRALRRHVIIKNTDTSLTAHVGIASVTTGNGMPILAGESIRLETQALVQVIAASGAPVLAYVEFYD